MIQSLGLGITHLKVLCCDFFDVTLVVMISQIYCNYIHTFEELYDMENRGASEMRQSELKRNKILLFVMHQFDPKSPLTHYHHVLNVYTHEYVPSYKTIWVSLHW